VDVDEAVHVVSVGVSEQHLRDVVEVQASGGDRRRKLLLGVTSVRANGTFRAAAVSPVSTSRSTPSCSIAQQWTGSGAEKAPGRNRSSCRRGPWRGYRRLCLTRTARL
jgi:hypothetical protein